MTVRKKERWLERELMGGPYLCLCLSEGDFHAAIADMGQKHRDDWISNEQSDATAHHLVHPETHELCCIVCMRLRPDSTAMGICGLLVHEAVHVFQQWCDHIGETNPGRESEAYGIQRIAQRLMASYAEQQ